MRLSLRNLIVLLIMTTLILTMPAFALATAYHDRLQPYADQYNDNLDQIPKMARWPFANERINLTIVSGDETEVIGITTTRGEVKITSFTAGGVDSPTLLVTVDGAALDAVLDAPTKEGALQLARGAQIRGVGLFRSLKAAIFRLAVRFV